MPKTDPVKQEMRHSDAILGSFRSLISSFIVLNEEQTGGEDFDDD